MASNEETNLHPAAYLVVNYFAGELPSPCPTGRVVCVYRYLVCACVYNVEAKGCHISYFVAFQIIPLRQGILEILSFSMALALRDACIILPRFLCGC